MQYHDFLNKVIDEGIEAATNDYIEEKYKLHLEGSIAGFEACRNKTPSELLEIWEECQEYILKVPGNRKDMDKYWWFKCYQLEVEWVCNVISVVLIYEGKPPILSWLPTFNGMLKAASIIKATI